MRILLATIAAIVVQPIVFAGLIAPDYFASSQPSHEFGLLFLSIVVIAAAVILTLGIPAFLVLRRYQLDTWKSLAITGFVLGSVPMAVIAWPHILGGLTAGYNWHGKFVYFYTNGQPTTYAWLSYGENLIYYGIHGLVGSLVFYAVWFRLSRPNL